MSAERRGPGLSVHLVLLFVQVVFGSFHVVAKAVLAEAHPLALGGLRVAFATPLLLAIAWRHDRLVPRRSDLPVLALLGLLGVFANQLLFIVGLRLTTAINAAILMCAIPVFAAALGGFLGIERLGPRRLAGIGLSVAGALAMLDPSRFAGGGRTLAGNALILGNCVAYALFLVLQRPVVARLPWRTVIAWAFVFGGAGVLAVAWPQLVALEPLSLGAWLGIAYIVLFPTALAYALSTWAVRRSSPALVAAYTTLQPLVSWALAAAFLGERLGWLQGLGFALIAAGLWLVSGRLPQPD